MADPADEVLRPLLDVARAALPPEAVWFDAHTHIGQNDPDGVTGTADGLLHGLDRAGQRHALVFPMHEPGGYAEANVAVRDAARASGGRLAWLGRVDPNRDGAVAEARRCLEGGAAGMKLHPRSDDFRLPHPVVDDVAALVADRRGVLLFHAGRGIPRLGEAALALARRHPDLRVVLAHAAISDLGLLLGPERDVANLLFDTAWWQVWDLLQLFGHVAPGRILYASDMPYGGTMLSALLFLRVAREVGHDGEVLAAMAGGHLAHLLAGGEPLDLGSAPGPPSAVPRVLGRDRAVAYVTAAAQITFGGGDPAEAIALARLACQTRDGDPVLEVVDGLLDHVEEERRRARSPVTETAPGEAAGDGSAFRRHQRWPGVHALVAAQGVAGTPSVPVA